MRKRFISMLLVFAMILTMVPAYTVTASAADPEPEFYAVFTSDGTLSFYYDTEIASYTDAVATYTNLPTEAASMDAWGYDGIRSSVKAVAIDPSVESYSGLKSTAYMFSDMYYAKSISGCEYLNVSNVTDMTSMFANYAYQSTGFHDVPNVANWDTRNVTNMSYTFYAYAYKSTVLNVVPNVAGWNTSNVTNMAYMFDQYAYSSTIFNAVPNVAGWNTSNVTNMACMFNNYAYSSTVLNVVPNVTDWNTDNVENMLCMFSSYGFSSTEKLAALDLSGWSIDALTNATCMFYGYAHKSPTSPVVYATDWSANKATGVVGSYMFMDSKLKGTTAGDWQSARTGKDGCFTSKFYAVLTSDGTLSFYYDNQVENREGTTYTDLPTQATKKEDWGYNRIRENVTGVVIDSSVASYSDLKSTAYMFSDMLYATSISGCEYLDVSNVTNMDYMFASYGRISTTLADIPNVTSWNTSNVVNMTAMFYCYAAESSEFNAVPDVSNWDTSKVTNVTSMFERYASNSKSSIPQTLDLSGWSINSLTAADGMFYKYFSASPEGTPVVYAIDWFAIKPTGISAADMFTDSKLKGTTTGNWQSARTGKDGCFTSKFYAVFTGDGTLSFYYDTEIASHTDAVATFADLPTEAASSDAWGYDSIRSKVKAVVIDESVKNYSGLKSTAYMFYYMSNANSIRGCENLYVNNVTNMCKMFQYYGRNSASLTDVPDVSDWNTGKVTDMSDMFRNYGYKSASLTDVPDVSDWNTGNVTDMSNMFMAYAYSSKVFNDIPDVSNWNTGNVTDMSSMFYGYAGLSTVLDKVPNVAGWDTENVTNMTYMFRQYATASTVLNAVPDVAGWDTENVTLMAGMFYTYAKSSTVLDKVPNVSGWNTENVTNMTSMFYGYADGSQKTLAALDLSGWSIDALTDATYMFYGYASNNPTSPVVYATDWSETKATGVTATGMFTDSKLKGTITGNWTSANTSDTGCFTKKPVEETYNDVVLYSVGINASENGSVTASPMNTSENAKVTLTVKADKGYALDTLSVTLKSGKEVSLTTVTLGEKYTFRMPAGNVTVKATFKEAKAAVNNFADVKESDYFYDAVLWATTNGITNGVDETHFDPKAPTTRGQMITFLWRCAGCPEPTVTETKFTDLKTTQYYYKAVLWAVENGITSGTTETTFEPNAPLTRAQAVTFLWRYEGSTSAVTTDVPFTDLKKTQFYYDAVLWAAEQGISSGTTEDTFSPQDGCIRAQAVTFLYRNMGK